MVSRASSAEEAFLALCNKHKDGVSQVLLEKELAGFSEEARTAAVNNLLKNHRVQVFTPLGGQVFFKAVDPELAAKFKGLTAEDTLVYQQIKNSANTGIWTKDLKARTNLQQTQVTKILRTLEQRKLIKAVKSVASANRKVYMAYEVDPAPEITGGAWYTEHEFDEEFIGVLRDACYRFVGRQGEATLHEIATFIREKGFARVELSDTDVSMVVDTLQYDGMLDCIDGAEGDLYRHALHEIPKATAFSSVPCGVCPVFNECTPDGVISPATCIYYNKWLEF